MKKIITLSILMTMMAPACLAAATEGTPGEVSGRSVGAAALSFFIWPGIGQVVNGEPKDKNITHAVLGLTGVFRFWSAYDAFVDRSGGVWHNRI